MAPVSLRLDSLALVLVERLEASRKSWIGNENAAGESIVRIVNEAAVAIATECREVYGDSTQADRILSEAQTTFLPRYTRLALEQNRIESRPFGIVPGDIFPRLIGAFVAFILAELVARRIPGGFGFVAFLMPFLALAWPELRGWWVRRHYRAALQELVDDMGRIDAALAELPDTSLTTRGAATQRSEPVPAAPAHDPESESQAAITQKSRGGSAQKER